MAKRSRQGPRCRSSLWILALEILPFLREFDPVTDAMESQPFLADVDFLPLSSSRTSALEWLQIAPEERPAEEAQPTVKAKSAPTHPSPKRPAQKRMTTDHGSTCRPGFNSCGLDPYYLKSVGSPEDQPRKAGRDGIRDGHTTAGACISSAFQFLNACHACHACRAPVPVSQCSWLTSFQISGFSFAKDSDPVPSPTRSGDEAELIPSEEGFLEQVAREQILKWDRAQAKWTQWLGAAETRNSAHGDRQN